MPTDVQIKRIPASVGTIAPYQICIEPNNDTDIGIKLLGYQDSAGNAYKVLVKDQKIQVSSIVVTAFGSAGFVKNTVAGLLQGGQSITGSDVPDHDDLNGKSGGTPGEYYHLTAAQENEVAIIAGGLTDKLFLLGDASGNIDQTTEISYNQTKKIFTFGSLPNGWEDSFVGDGGFIQYPEANNVIASGSRGGIHMLMNNIYYAVGGSPTRADNVSSAKIEIGIGTVEIMIDEYAGEAADTTITAMRQIGKFSITGIEHNISQVTDYVFKIRSKTNVNGFVFDAETGILCIGAIPKVWDVGKNVLMLEDLVSFMTEGSTGNLSCNAYIDVEHSRWEYIKNAPASFYSFGGGVHTFYGAINGTADNPITWITQLTLGNNEVIINDGGNDISFRVEGKVFTHAIYLNSSEANGGTADRIGLHNDTPLVALDSIGIHRFGDSIDNYTQILDNGRMEFYGLSRINWQKIIANSLTLVAGSSESSLSDLQTAHDGNFYHVDEVAATPGQNLIIDFVDVTAFNWVDTLCCYTGGSTHAVAIQVYNWAQTRWDTFGGQQNDVCDITTSNGYILTNHSFFIPDDTEYIGTGDDEGDVRVRFYHTMTGNGSHDMDIDVVALYQ